MIRKVILGEIYGVIISLESVALDAKDTDFRSAVKRIKEDLKPYLNKLIIYTE